MKKLLLISLIFLMGCGTTGKVTEITTPHFIVYEYDADGNAVKVSKIELSGIEEGSYKDDKREMKASTKRGSFFGDLFKLIMTWGIFGGSK